MAAMRIPENLAKPDGGARNVAETAPGVARVLYSSSGIGDFCDGVERTGIPLRRLALVALVAALWVMSQALAAEKRLVHAEDRMPNKLGYGMVLSRIEGPDA
jgi:hypothetical protein